MNEILEEFDTLRRHIKTDKGKQLSKQFRKTLKRSEIYADKLDLFFRTALDSGEISDKVAKDCGLL